MFGFGIKSQAELTIANQYLKPKSASALSEKLDSPAKTYNTADEGLATMSFGKKEGRPLNQDIHSTLEQEYQNKNGILEFPLSINPKDVLGLPSDDEVLKTPDSFSCKKLSFVQEINLPS